MNGKLRSSPISSLVPRKNLPNIVVRKERLQQLCAVFEDKLVILLNLQRFIQWIALHPVSTFRTQYCQQPWIILSMQQVTYKYFYFLLHDFPCKMSLNVSAHPRKQHLHTTCLPRIAFAKCRQFVCLMYFIDCCWVHYRVEMLGLRSDHSRGDWPANIKGSSLTVHNPLFSVHKSGAPNENIVQNHLTQHC